MAGGLALAFREQTARPVADNGRVGGTGHAADAAAAALEHLGRSSSTATASKGPQERRRPALLTHGYRHAIPADAPNLAYARSLVLFRPGWQREAERLGKDARIATVAPLDGRVAPAYAHVPLVVILGAN